MRNDNYLTSLIIIVPSMASFRSFKLLRSIEITFCILSISCLRNMFIELRCPIFIKRAFTLRKKAYKKRIFSLFFFFYHLLLLFQWLLLSLFFFFLWIYLYQMDSKISFAGNKLAIKFPICWASKTTVQLKWFLFPTDCT